MRSHQQRQTCRLWLLENEDVCSTIFSSSSMSSAWRLAAMNAFTATDTCSGFLLSGRAVDTTCAAGGFHQGIQHAPARLLQHAVELAGDRCSKECMHALPAQPTWSMC
jgi:hypothetical protein